MRRGVLALSLGVVWGAGAHALALPAAPLVGAVYPGASLLESVRPAGGRCVERYRFRVNASLEQVARFYTAQGEAAGLRRAGDPPKARADGWMALFEEVNPPPGRFLFVIVDADGPQVTGRVVYQSSRSGSCA